MTDRGWRKSSYSDQVSCVEIKFVARRVLVRNSRRPEAAPIAFSTRSWQEFLSALTAGEMVPTRPGG